MTGYSGTPLPKKLGIKEGSKVGVFGAPADFSQILGDLPPDSTIHKEVIPSEIFVIFSTQAIEMEAQFHTAMAQIPAHGAIWVAWPKRSSGVETDMTEDTMRDMFLPTGMVDNKVCAIDETWSGLRFVVRLENRQDWNSPA